MKKPKLIAVGGCGSPKQNPSKDNDMHKFYREIEADVLARTLWGEARGEGTYGMQAVANVILNRVKLAEKKGRYWWGNNVIQVCQKPYQFSCWNRADPNFKKLQAVDETNAHFASAMNIAKRALMNKLDDPSGGATHYHAKGIMPYWARGEQPTTRIGSHIFYKIIES